MKEKLDRLIALLEQKKKLGTINEGETIYLSDLKISRTELFGPELDPLPTPQITSDPSSPRSCLFVQENLLSPLQCQIIIDYARKAIKPSGVIGQHNDDQGNPYRTSWDIGLSESYHHSDELNDLIRKLKENIAILTRIPIEHQETFTIIRYQEGEEYKPHHDYFSDAGEEVEQVLRNGGERVATALICLQAPEEGGETEFPLLNLKIKQEQGKAIFWQNGNPDVTELYEETLHAGLPVIKGEKWMMTCWIRQTPIASI